MGLLDQIHEKFVYDRRTDVLLNSLAPRFPAGARILDVGCGDGLISKGISLKCPSASVQGIDVLVRPKPHIPVAKFDGTRIPYEDNSFDAVLFVDVLHHTDDPMILLKEAARVSRNLIVLKDHTKDGLLAGPTLHFMDVVGNARHGVASPANYWTEQQWRTAFEHLDLSIKDWTGRLSLYPWWASWAFGRGLHFVASLQKRPS